MRKYTVTADVESQKFGKGKLVAELTEPEFIEYANLSDRDKLAFLKDKGAEFHASLEELSDDEVSGYKVEQKKTTKPNVAPHVASDKPMRQMRFNINGRDSGWIDVNEQNEDQYNQLMNHFNDMNQRFRTMTQRMNEEFQHFFLGFGQEAFLDHFDHSPFGLLSHNETPDDQKKDKSDFDKENEKDADKE
ncbi:MAG: hypothetical protein Q4A55_00275 [Aerococcus sp.]|nr:hypothetical protein [Aerococcus sp.]